MTDIIDRLDELANDVAAGPIQTISGSWAKDSAEHEHMCLKADFQKALFDAWPEISKRIRAAEAVCDAALPLMDYEDSEPERFIYRSRLSPLMFALQTWRAEDK